MSSDGGTGGRSAASRLDALAREKATLQLVLRLIERLDPLLGIEDLLREMLTSIVDTIGGTDSTLYYWDAGDLHRVNLGGENVVVADLDDSLAREVASRRAFVERELAPDASLLVDAALGRAFSWGFPLVAGAALIGVVVIHNLQMGSEALGRHLPVFFDHAALILCNELQRRHRDRAERALRQSENRYRALFESIHDAVFVHPIRGDDSDGRFEAVNDVAAQRLGYSVDELLTMSPRDIDAHGDALDAVRGVELLKREGRATFETEHVTRDGRRLPVEIGARVLREGDRLLVVGIARDITDRKRAEAALRESKEFYEEVNDHIVDGVGVTDERDRLTYLNRAAEQMFGAVHGAAIGLEARHSSATALLGELLDRYREARDTLTTMSFEEVAVFSRDGKALFASGWFVPRVVGGRYNGMIITVRDVTERRRARAVVREQEARLRVLGDNLPSGYVYQLEAIDGGAGRRFSHVSAGVERLHGVTVEDVLRDPMTLYGQLAEEDRARMAALEAEALATLKPFSAEVRYRNRAGETRWMLLRSAPRRTAQGELIWDGASLDVTERKRAEEEQARLSAMLVQAQKMEAIGQLAGGVAHDFNNILTAMLMNIELLSEELPECGQEPRRELEDSARRAAALTRQLLLFSRREVMRARPTELNGLIANLSKMLERLIGEHITLECRGEDHPARVDGDPGMLEQVIMNLVVNARDAMPDGGRIVIDLRTVVLDEASAGARPEARAGAYVVLEVSDTGCGMSPETLTHLFEPFYTTKGPGKGTGLGLATAYGIARQHRGWIEVDSTPGRGSTFRVVLPALDRAPTTAEASPSDAAVLGGGERLLVVEDDEALLRTITRALRQAGYEVLTASNGRDALSLWSGPARDVALVVSDVVMPGGVTGFELVRALLRDRPDLKVILLSGYNTEARDIELLGRPSVQYLPKPLSISDLTRAVRSALDGARASTGA